MFRKALYWILMMAMLGNCLCVAAYANSSKKDGFTYQIKDGQCIILSYDGYSDEVIIPKEIEGCPVTGILFGAFMRESIVSISIPDSITDLQEGIFRLSRGLKKLIVSPDHPRYATIDGVLFDKTERKLVCYPCGRDAANYEIPEGICSIGNLAFENCLNLTMVTIPQSVATVGDDIFAGCKDLSSISVAPDNPRFTSIDGVLIDKAEQELVCFPNGKVCVDYVIPEGICSIGKGAFMNCRNLTSVTIPDGVTTIGEAAFQRCTMTSISIPNSVMTIGDEAFLSCLKMQSIVLPDSVTTIGEAAFQFCKMTSFHVPDGVTTIGDAAFYGCDKLTSIVVPDGVTRIGAFAFFECKNLSACTIPGSVKSIGEEAFGGCENLTSIKLKSDDSDNMTTDVEDNAENRTSGENLQNENVIGKAAFRDCWRLESVTIPDGVTDIGEDAFYCCSLLTGIEIPASVTTIGAAAFYGCNSLKDIAIPDGMTFIDQHAFAHCTGLTSLSIPESVISISSWAFSGCSNLTSIDIPESVVYIGDGAFDNCSNLTLSVVRDSYAAEYANANGLSYTYPDANDWLNP